MLIFISVHRSCMLWMANKPKEGLLPFHSLVHPNRSMRSSFQREKAKCISENEAHLYLCRCFYVSQRQVTAVYLLVLHDRSWTFRYASKMQMSPHSCLLMNKHLAKIIKKNFYFKRWDVSFKRLWLQVFVHEGEADIHWKREISQQSEVMTHSPWRRTLLVAESPRSHPDTHPPFTQPVSYRSLSHTCRGKSKYKVRTFMPCRNT